LRREGKYLQQRRDTLTRMLRKVYCSSSSIHEKNYKCMYNTLRKFKVYELNNWKIWVSFVWACSLQDVHCLILSWISVCDNV
jgi:hypothetical protein